MSELRIPYPTERAAKRGLDLQKWGVLINTTFPNATTEDAIINAWDLAQVRGLDVFSGHIAIVTQRRRVDHRWFNQETCWLTLKAQIFTAHKTGAFAGIDPITFGPMIERTFKGYFRQEEGPNQEKSVTIRAPEYVVATVYRFVNGQRCAFSDTLFLDEVIPISQNLPTAMWAKAPTLMLSKCAKAAALRLGFAECDYSADEMDGQLVNLNQTSGVATDAAPDKGTVETGDVQATGDQPQSGSGSASGTFPAPFNEAAFTSEAITSFSQAHARALHWLDRNLENATSLGAYEEAIDNIKATLEPELHAIGIKLTRAAETVRKDARGTALWNYIGQARSHGGQAFDAAMRELANQASARKLTQEASDAAHVVLNFLKALGQTEGRAAA